MSNARILRRHPLEQFPELKVGDEVFAVRYDKGCSMSNCRGRCCADGVDVDIAERDRILQHADLIRPHMDETQDRDSTNWFQKPFADSDFPSGTAATTRLKSNGCVFLNKDGACVVHIAESQAPPGFGNLKPFFCRAFPICILNSTLSIDDEQCPDDHQCCGPVKNGPLTIFDICAFELEYVLGTDGLSELRELASVRANNSSDQVADPNPVPA